MGWPSLPLPSPRLPTVPRLGGGEPPWHLCNYVRPITAPTFCGLTTGKCAFKSPIIHITPGFGTSTAGCPRSAAAAAPQKNQESPPVGKFRRGNFRQRFFGQTVCARANGPKGTRLRMTPNAKATSARALVALHWHPPSRVRAFAPNPSSSRSTIQTAYYSDLPVPRPFCPSFFLPR